MSLRPWLGEVFPSQCVESIVRGALLCARTSCLLEEFVKANVHVATLFDTRCVCVAAPRMYHLLRLLLWVVVALVNAYDY